MKLAFSRPSGNENERDLLFNNYQEVGYQGLQLKNTQYLPYIQKPELFLEKWGHLEGVASALIFGGNLDEDNLKMLRNLFSFAEQVDTESIVFCHGIPRDQSNDKKLQEYARILSDLALEAKEDYGVQLSLHHHFNQPVMYRRDFDIFFETVERNSVTLTVDTAHLYKSGISDISEVIYTFRDKIDNFHMKDYLNGEWKVLGYGEIDFKPIFKSINEVGYNGWISADEESGGEIIRGMQDCLEFMKKGLQQRV